jgi:hypothetical protein
MHQTTPPERMMGVGALASLSAGFVAGIGARIIMRIVALTSHMPVTFSIAGTLNILIQATFLGFVVGFIGTMIIVPLSTSPKASKYLPGPIWRGLIWGALLLLSGLPIFITVNAADLVLGIPLLDTIMFEALVIVYGLTLGVAEVVFNHVLPRKPPSDNRAVLTPVPSEDYSIPWIQGQALLTRSQGLASRTDQPSGASKASNRSYPAWTMASNSA